MPSVSATWKAKNDARTCPICKAMNGYTWVFKDVVPDSLVHPSFGEVWNTSIGSLAHEHQQTILSGHKISRTMKYGLLSNCRCHVEPHFDLKDLLVLIKKLRDEIKGEVEAPDYQTGSHRTTTADDIGVDLTKYGLE